MKKTLLLAAGLLAGQFAIAQTLTKANNEPVVGDVHTIVECDTVNAIPKNTGQGQHWDFSSLQVFTLGTTSSTFIPAASAPNYTAFPGATLAEDSGDDYYLFYKSATSPTTQLEMLGNVDASTPSSVTVFNYTNSAVELTWPFSFGNTFSDAFAGTGNGSFSGTEQGSSTVTATGTGTITLPGGISVHNILQVKTVMHNTASFSQPFVFSYTANSTQYDYYAPGFKFPLLTVNVELGDDGTSIDTSIYITMNSLVLTTDVGIKEKTLDASYSIFPNPAKDNVTIKLSNNDNEKCNVTIYDLTGQLVKTISLGKASVINEKISLSGLNSGIYMVKTSLGNSSSSRRLIIE